MIMPAAVTIQTYCHNKGLLDQLQQTNTKQYPQDTIQDDYLIIKEIQIIIQQLLPITIQQNHVKGHQDNVKLDQSLTIPETLNIECNKRATTAMEMYLTTVTEKHPMTAAGYPHLLINGEVQYQKLQHQLCAAATNEEYQKYMMEKFGWINQEYRKIQWPVYQQAFNCLTITKCKFISKLTHEWLPLQASHILQNPINQQQCPSCKCSDKTAVHFLQCPNNKRQAIWEAFQQSLQKFYVKNQLLQPIQDALSEAYQLSRDDMQPTPNHLQQNAPMMGTMTSQQKLGWKHLIHG